MSENLSSKIGNKEKPVNKTGLPLDYGDTKITILPRDPICIFAYWSISNEYIDKLVRQNSERTKLVPQACKLIYLKANSENKLADILLADPSFLKPGQIDEIKADIKQSGCADVDNNGTSDDEVNNYLEKSVADWFKKEGGLCNDGKAHL